MLICILEINFSPYVVRGLKNKGSARLQEVGGIPLIEFLPCSEALKNYI